MRYYTLIITCLFGTSSPFSPNEKIYTYNPNTFTIWHFEKVEHKCYPENIHPSEWYSLRYLVEVTIHRAQRWDSRESVCEEGKEDVKGGQEGWFQNTISNHPSFCIHQCQRPHAFLKPIERRLRSDVPWMRLHLHRENRQNCVRTKFRTCLDRQK